MTSAIDATKPADGVPASKADLRNNLSTIETELNHGGFAVGLSPSSYSPSPADDKLTSHLTGIDAAIAGVSGSGAFPMINVKASPYNATGDGVTDDTTAIQAAIDAVPSIGGVVFFPRGTYVVSSTLTVPLSAVAGVVKAVHFRGEGGAFGGGGSVGGVAQGASSLKYTGSGGACIDAMPGTWNSALDPRWPGSIRHLALHNSGSGTTIGLKANGLINFQMYDVMLSYFSDNIQINGEYYYSSFEWIQSRGGHIRIGATVGSGPVSSNGAEFRNCWFREGTSTTEPHVIVGLPLATTGQPLIFSHCWIERNAGGAMYIGEQRHTIIQDCYFERNSATANGAIIDYDGLPASDHASDNILSILNSYFFSYAAPTGTNPTTVVSLDQGGSGRLLVRVEGCQCAPTIASMPFLSRAAGMTLTPSIIAIGNKTITTTNRVVPIYADAIPGDVDEFVAIDCSFTEDKGLARTVKKGAWSTV